MNADRYGTHFRAVLDVERTRLGAVVQASDLQLWRRSVVRELMDARSPHAQVLRRGTGTREHRAFVSDWQLLVAAAVRRVLPPTEAKGEAPGSSPRGPDPDQVALSVLAALHGGAVLSWLAGDERPIEAAFDIALAPLTGPRRLSADV